MSFELDQNLDFAVVKSHAGWQLCSWDKEPVVPQTGKLPRELEQMPPSGLTLRKSGAHSRNARSLDGITWKHPNIEFTKSKMHWRSLKNYLSTFVRHCSISHWIVRLVEMSVVDCWLSFVRVAVHSLQHSDQLFGLIATGMKYVDIVCNADDLVERLECCSRFCGTSS